MTLEQAIQLAFDHHQSGRLVEAESIYRQVLQQVPKEVNALHGLGYLTFRTGRIEEGMQLMREAIEVAPELAHLHWGLAEMLHSQHREEESAAEMRTVIRLQPERADAYVNLGLTLLNLNQVNEAADACRRAIALNPKDSNAHNQMACVYLAMHCPEEAACEAEVALQLFPKHAGAANNIAQARMMQGDVAESLAQHRRTHEIQPDYPMAQSNLLFTLQYTDANASEIVAEHLRWGQSLESRAGAPRAHRNDRDPNRRLRIGYVSSDLRRHAIEYFIDPILAHHDRSKFEVTAYSNNFVVDATTQRLQKHLDHWRPIHSLSDEAVADLVAREQIDVLVDLSVHTSGNRLGVFARKPAPVQMTYLGYPGTTGLTRMDYRITAGGLDRLGVNEGPEQLLALPHSYFCYAPPEITPDVAAAPFLSNGYVTFGSFNRLAKMSGRAVAIWARILNDVSGSKLEICTSGLAEPPTRTLVFDRFAAHGISSDRIILRPYTSESLYFSAHHRVDIVLDTFPYNGGTTTLHALWMGVPVIALAGERAIARLGSNILTTIGLSDLVAKKDADYIAKAVALAKDPHRLSNLRRGMRSRLRQSPAMQPEQFTRDLERLYRLAWVRWTETNPR